MRQQSRQHNKSRIKTCTGRTGERQREKETETEVQSKQIQRILRQQHYQMHATYKRQDTNVSQLKEEAKRSVLSSFWLRFWRLAENVERNLHDLRAVSINISGRRNWAHIAVSVRYIIHMNICSDSWRFIQIYQELVAKERSRSCKWKCKCICI